MMALGAAFAVYAGIQPVEAIEQPTATAYKLEASNNTPAAAQTAENLVTVQAIKAKPHAIRFKVGVNPYAVAEEKREAAAAAKKKAEAEAAAKKKAAALAAAKKAAAVKAAAAKKAALAAAAAKKAAAAKAVAARAAATRSATATQTSYTATSGRSAGTFRVTFYDPAVLGSSMGYGGIAANLSVLPRGTRVKIQMSNGQTLYRTVNDTGGFAAGNPHQIDVAMPNNQIPSAGVLSAVVTIL
ncbi:hydrolase [Lacticaseibacillus kribbianus]|uniref:hydrolase n=1 Tax=Lacticaseibacillus kribbianus TaxID=2926292 RepID=UPI001CD605CD|nr:hydrolase [Lacticaseibacillus kribbianus]